MKYRKTWTKKINAPRLNQVSSSKSKNGYQIHRRLSKAGEHNDRIVAITKYGKDNRTIENDGTINGNYACKKFRYISFEPAFLH